MKTVIRYTMYDGLQLRQGDSYDLKFLRYGVLGKEEFVCKLLKALYRLQQAPRAWYSKIDSFLNEIGLLKLNADYNLYYFEEGGRIAILILYVDDLYMIGDHVEKINWPQEEIKKHFFMTDLGILAHLLGIEFIFHEYGNTMTQRRYITTTLEEFELIDCNACWKGLSLN